MNDYLFEAIKIKLLEDFETVYDYYKSKDESVKGVEFKFNVTRGFGEYIYTNTDKLVDMVRYFNDNISFPYKFHFHEIGDEEFYPMMEKGC